MVFPRFAGYVEIGWSQLNDRNWDEYKERLAEHGLCLEKMLSKAGQYHTIN